MVAGERIVAKLRKDLYSSLIVQEIGFFDETKTGELLNRLSSDCVILFKLYWCFKYWFSLLIFNIFFVDCSSKFAYYQY